jgi:hypothetical protein
VSWIVISIQQIQKGGNDLASAPNYSQTAADSNNYVDEARLAYQRCDPAKSRA